MRNKIILLGLIFFLLSVSLSFGQKEGEEKRIKGFTHMSSKIERQIEEKLKSLPEPENCKKYSRYLTEEPHMAGTEENYKLAQYVRDKFKEFGLEEV